VLIVQRCQQLLSYVSLTLIAGLGLTTLASCRALNFEAMFITSG